MIIPLEVWHLQSKLSAGRFEVTKNLKLLTMSGLPVSQGTGKHSALLYLTAHTRKWYAYIAASC